LKPIFQPWLKDNKLSLNLFSKSVHFMLKIYTYLVQVKLKVCDHTITDNITGEHFANAKQ